MSHAPYPSIDEPGIVQEVAAEFVSALRKPLPAFALFAGKETRVGHWGIESLKWREVSELSDVVVSMDIPPVQGDSGTMTTKTVEIPIFTKDLTMSGRKWRQMIESGLDPVATHEAARAMAIEMNGVLLRGTGAGKPGPSTGLLNDAGVSLSPGGDWTTSSGVNASIADAMKVLQLALHTGPYALVVPAANTDLLQQFIGDGHLRIGDNLPLGISRILVDHDGVDGEAYLVDEDIGNYDVVSPKDEGLMRFGLGTVSAGFMSGPTMQHSDDLMVEKTLRFMNMLAPRVIRPAGTVKLSYTS